MQKWGFFTMGMMSGIIVLLVFALLSQHGENLAYAKQATDNDGKGLIMATGGSQQGIQDIVWVLHEHPPLPALKVEGTEESKDLRKEKRLSLLLYRCENQAKSMKLISARDLSYDEEMMDYNCEKPKVGEIYADLKKQAERNKGK